MMMRWRGARNFGYRIHPTMDSLHLLRYSDLKELLDATTAELPGRILRLNRSPKYDNSLDAIAISVDLMERRAGEQQNPFRSNLSR